MQPSCSFFVCFLKKAFKSFPADGGNVTPLSFCSPQPSCGENLGAMASFSRACLKSQPRPGISTECGRSSDPTDTLHWLLHLLQCDAEAPSSQVSCAAAAPRHPPVVALPVVTRRGDVFMSWASLLQAVFPWQLIAK